MGLISINNLEDGVDATANLFNQRFGIIADAINGNLDSQNLADNAVTREKIASGAVTSDKLGFTKYVDDNGWLITDLGLVKLATKNRTATTKPTGLNSAAFLTWDATQELLPVGFNSTTSTYNATFHATWQGSSGNWGVQVEDGGLKWKPETPPVATRIAGGNSSGGERVAIETWIIF